MKRIVFVFAATVLIACKGTDENPEQDLGAKEDSTLIESAVEVIEGQKPVKLTLSQANSLAELPLGCINVEYPNKLNQTLSSSQEIAQPSELHPAFYGCFDWHSSVHAHWTLVSLLKQFPDLEKQEEIRNKLQQSLSKDNILAEVRYFENPQEANFERTYGWAWVLKLAEELHSWDDPLAKELEGNMEPLTTVITEKFKSFLPKLVYPIRVGEHSNTAFALSFAYDYAKRTEKVELQKMIETRAREFYLTDDNCPLAWEPSGFDFLSPCFSEIDIMRRILPENAFRLWMEDFMPQLKNEEFLLEVAEVSDRTDGKLVHLDGLNFSRAWVLHGLANQYPERYGHLKVIANRHISHSFPNLVDDSYEGGHWLGSFAVYALKESKVKE